MIIISHETVVWLNRVAIILGFLSFWFVAPEFIGEQRLRMWELKLGKQLPRLPKMLKWVFAMWTIIVTVLYVVALLWTEKRWPLPVVSPTTLMISAILSGLLLATQVFVEPVVRKLANDTSVRQTSL